MITSFITLYVTEDARLAPSTDILVSASRELPPAPLFTLLGRKWACYPNRRKANKEIPA